MKIHGRMVIWLVLCLSGVTVGLNSVMAERDLPSSAIPPEIPSQPGELDHALQIDAAYEYLETFEKSPFHLKDARQHYSVVRADRDRRGVVHVRFQQQYQGLEVVGRHVIVHVNSLGRAFSASGLCQQGIDIDVNTARTPDDAMAIAMSSSEYVSREAQTVVGNAVIYVKENTPVLAWRTLIEGEDVGTLLYFIDDGSGEILSVQDITKRAGSSSCLPAQGQGQIRYWEGLSARYDSLTVPVWDTGWFMVDVRRQLDTSTIHESCQDGSVTGDMEGHISIYFDTGSLGQNRLVVTDSTIGDSIVVFADPTRPEYYEAATDAFYFTSKTYDWFLEAFDWNSYDGQGSAMEVVAVKDNDANCGMCQAIGTGSQMSVRCNEPCDTSETRFLAGSPHVMAHEWAHAIMTNTSGVPGGGGSGYEGLALMEGWPVMMGEAFKHWLPDSIAPDSTLWRPGAYLFKQGASYKYIFNCEDPDDIYAASVGADYYSDTGTCGDTLFDPDAQTAQQTILHKWFQLLSDGNSPPCSLIAGFSSIGVEAAAEIAFAANCYYWWPDIGFVDAAIQTCEAAVSLDTTLNWAQSANEAWAMVGVLDAIDSDSDGFYDDWDNCPDSANADQADDDQDGIGDACQTCCQLRADLNHDGLVNIADVTYSTDWRFKYGPPPPCIYESDFDADASYDIADHTALVAYMFRSGPAPVPCP